MSAPSLLCGEWIVTEPSGNRQPPIEPPDVAIWNGEEQRSGKERRQVERRGEQARGRRYRMADRRRS